MKEMFVYHWISDEESKIRMYGISPEGKNVCLRVENFQPYAYVQVPFDDMNLVRMIQESISSHVVSSKLVYKHHLYNFQNKKAGEKSPFLLCHFESKKKIVNLSYVLDRGVQYKHNVLKLKVFESSANPILQMVSNRNVPMSGWVDFSKDCPNMVPEEDAVTNCDEEYIVKWKKLGRSEREEQVIPKCIAFDMEVNSEIISQMPSDKPRDCIFQISCVVTEKDKDRRKVLLSLDDKNSTLKDSELLKDVDVKIFENEKALLLGFMDFISHEKPNVITGFNIFGFDIEYAMKRANRYFVSENFRMIGFNKSDPAQVEQIKWSSSAYKNQVFKFLNWEGILLLDLLPIIKRDYKLDTYTLKNVTHTFLNNNTKDPVTHKDIFKAFVTRENMDVVGKYCVQDSSLCIDLMEHLHTWVSLSEMAKVCNVSMFTLYTQGQQIKLYSQVYKHCLGIDVVVDAEGYESKSNERYRGAHVIEPIPGFYKRVVPVDFSSLYPSLIIAHNICYSTIVGKDVPDDQCNTFEWEDHVGCEHDPKMIKINLLTEKIDKMSKEIESLRKMRDSINSTNVKHGSTVKEEKLEIQKRISELVEMQKPYREERCELKKNKVLDYEDESGNKISGVMCAKRCYRFLKPEVKKGVIPTIIQNMLDSRKRVKNAMKDCEPNKKIVLDKEQLAYKVSANSMYGAMGVRRGYLPFMPGAMCVTYTGRTALEKTAELIQTKFGGTLVYGDTDSNYVTFPHIEDVKETWDYAIKVADGVTNWEENGKRVFPRPIKLEFENTIYEKFLILSKKRYMYQSIDRDGNLDKKIGKKGVILARRDNSQIVREVYENVVMMIFDNREKEDLEKFVNEYVANIYDNKFEYKNYIITKSVGDSGTDVSDDHLGDYKVKTLPSDEEEKSKILNGKTERDYYISKCPAHVQLAEKMKKRGIPVDVGSRIEYVITGRPRAVTLGGKIEDYEYFVRHSNVLYLDYKYYVDAMINPLDQIFNTMGYGSLMKDIAMKWERKVDEDMIKPKFNILNRVKIS